MIQVNISSTFPSRKAPAFYLFSDESAAFTSPTIFTSSSQIEFIHLANLLNQDYNNPDLIVWRDF